MLHDLRFGLRLLRKAPGFTAAALALLALGIGLNSAMFTFVHALVFSPRAFADPERIVQLYTQDRKDPGRYRPFSYPVWRELDNRRDLFSGVLAFNLTLVGVQSGTETRRAFGSMVSSNYFETLGVPLARGRPFSLEEERPGAAEPVVIVSHAHWRKTGFSPDLLGGRLRINERDYTIVGITREGFSGTTALFGPEFYFPLGVYELLENFVVGEERRGLDRADAYGLYVVARLAPGVAAGSAGAALDAVGRSLEERHPIGFKDQTVALGPLPRLGTSSSPRSEGPVKVFGLVLLALAGSVLLIVCLNLSGLLLARGEARRKEFAVRRALGAGRRQLVRQMCLEGVLLAAGGGALGWLGARTAIDLLAAEVEARLPLTLFAMSAGSEAVIGATAALVVGATLAFSLGPALKFARSDVLTDLKLQGDTGAAGRRTAWWRPRQPRVVTQVALSLALLVVAGLFLRMTAGRTTADHGFRADNTVVAEVDASLGAVDDERGLELFRLTEERLGTLPGVQAAAVAAIVPYGFVHVGKGVRRDGPAPEPGSTPATAAEGRAYSGTWNAVGGAYFETMGIRVREGRAFTALEAGQRGAPPVAILDEALARRLWPEGGAVGQFVRFGDRQADEKGEARAMQVVGIVGGTRTEYFDDGEGGAVYVPFAQGYFANAHFHVRPRSDTPEAAAALVPAVRETLRTAATGVPVFKVRTFRQHAEGSMEVWVMRLGSALLGVFAAFALFVAAVGLYSVKSYQVTRRTREIGVRLALGATPGEVRRLVLGEGMATAGFGVAVGLALGVVINRLLAAVLEDIGVFDPAILGGAAAVLLVAAALASWFPARRATRVNPLEALRTE
jgi:predicted permease